MTLDPDDFRFLWNIKKDFLIEIGCFPGQPIREAYKCLREHLWAYADDCFKLAKWINSTLDEWPDTIIDMFSKKLLRRPVPPGIKRMFNAEMPMRSSKTIRFRRYEPKGVT